VRRLTTLVLALVIVAAGGAGCGGSSDKSTAGGRIALLLPDTIEARYEHLDRPAFERKVKQLCAECSVTYANAHDNQPRQQQQAEAALRAGAKVLVVDPPQPPAASAIAQRAVRKGVPVISYDRLILGADLDYWVTFDNVQVGALQGKALAGAAKRGGSVVMLNGDPRDKNARQFRRGARRAIQQGGLKVADSYDTPGWAPPLAGKEMARAIRKIGKDNVAGVYAANDLLAGAAIDAMRAAGIKPGSVPVTGNDATAAGVRRIVAGEQLMTVYKEPRPQAEKAAELAVALARGQTPSVPPTVDNELEDVPTVMLPALAVTRDRVKDTVVADGLFSASELCAGRNAEPCARLGIH
jgi:D-xylose transport system substrate-binding protein